MDVNPITLPKIFPDCVALYALTFDDQLSFADFPLPASVRASVPVRRAQFIAGRLCAQEALSAAGAQPCVELGIGPMRAPLWPPGFVGSITHTTRVAAAVAASTRNAHSLGIDLESIPRCDATTETASGLIASSDEMHIASRNGGSTASTFGTVFAAKEALFKCLAPLVGLYFDFRDVEVTSATDTALLLRLRVDLAGRFIAGRSFEVRFALVEDMVMAAAFLGTKS